VSLEWKRRQRNVGGGRNDPVRSRRTTKMQNEIESESIINK